MIGRPRSLVRNLIVVGLAGTLIGLLTSLAQTYLPFELSPLANSVGSWSVAAFLLALVETVPRRGALLGAVALATMLVGYAVATQLRGFAVGTALLAFWGAAALVAGPVLGTAATWVRGTDPSRFAVGVALLAGLLVGEGVYGLTVIGDTTPALYWVGEIAAGVATLVVAPWRRLRSPRHFAIGAGLTAAVATVFYVAYSGDLLALF